MVPMKCDAEGNVYFRAFQYPRPTAAPVAKISVDGKQVVHFALKNSNSSEIQEADITDFTVDLRGNVYLLARVQEESVVRFYIVGFTPEGKYETARSLDLGFFPAQIAVFASGEFLITGSNVQGEGAKATGEAVTAIFDRDGTFVKKIGASADVKIGPPAGGAKKDETAEPTEPTDPAAAIHLGMAMPGDDGNIYVLRAADEPFVLVISPAGEVLRKIVIKPSNPRYSKLLEIQVSSGKLVGQFQRSDVEEGRRYDDLVQYSVFDAATGERLMDYRPSPQLQEMFACYTPKGFTFLSSTPTMTELRRAAVR
jgi:hypothetical protein